MQLSYFGLHMWCFPSLSLTMCQSCDSPMGSGNLILQDRWATQRLQLSGFWVHFMLDLGT